MRILMVSSFYPPHRPAGYFLGCQDIAEALKSRGHEVRVLAGASGVKKEVPGVDVGRSLRTGSKPTSSWPTVFFKEWTNQAAFRMACLDFSPDVVFFFDLSQVSVSLVWLAQDMGLPVSFYFADNWFAIWERDQWRQVWPPGARGFRVLRWLSRYFALVTPERNLSFDHPIFVNRHLKSVAVELGRANLDAAVVPWGVDSERFSPSQTRRLTPSRLLYVGQLMPHKGLDVAIKALGILKRESGREDLSLTVVETKKDKFGPDFKRYFRELAQSCGVEDLVRFHPFRPRESMPEIYRGHDILIFPPAGGDGLSLTLLEAMASGLAVVSTPTCGHADVLKEEENALLFPAESAERCAQQVRRLLEDPGLFQSISSRARKTIEEEFRLEDSVLAIERELSKIAGQRQAFALPEKSVSPVALDKLSRRVRRWLVLGAIAVTLRSFLKPGFYARIVKRSFEKSASLAMLLVFPVLLETFFRLAGRRRHSFQVRRGFADQPKNVLVVQLADMGDVLLSEPFLRELRNFAPKARIILAIQPSMANLVENCPHVDEIVFFSWRKARNWRNAFSGSPLWWLQSTWITVRKLWKHRLDMALSLRWNNDPCQAASLILMFASSASERIGYQDYPHHLIGYKLTDVNRLITRGPVRGFPEHEIERQLGLLSFLGLKPNKASARMELWTNQEDEKFAATALGGSGFPRGGLLVAIAPGAAWEFRRWPAERFIELGRWLQESYGAFIMIFAARSEYGLALQVEKGLHPGQTLNLAGQTTIRQMGSLLRSCRLFIGNDSGPMHVAVASGVPVVGLFGPGEYERFRPWGPDHDVIRLTFPCSPCSQNCFFESGRCIRGITINHVKEIITRRLRLS